MSVIIRLQGLPWSASAMNIRHFFVGLNIPAGGVHIIGGEGGDAFIAFASDDDARVAMKRNLCPLNGTPVQLFLSSKSEMQSVIEAARSVSSVTPGGAAPASSTAPSNQGPMPNMSHANVPAMGGNVQQQQQQHFIGNRPGSQQTMPGSFPQRDGQGIGDRGNVMGQQGIHHQNMQYGNNDWQGNQHMPYRGGDQGFAGMSGMQQQGGMSGHEHSAQFSNSNINTAPTPSDRRMQTPGMNMMPFGSQQQGTGTNMNNPDGQLGGVVGRDAMSQKPRGDTGGPAPSSAGNMPTSMASLTSMTQGARGSARLQQSGKTDLNVPGNRGSFSGIMSLGRDPTMGFGPGGSLEQPTAAKDQVDEMQLRNRMQQRDQWATGPYDRHQDNNRFLNTSKAYGPASQAGDGPPMSRTTTGMDVGKPNDSVARDRHSHAGSDRAIDPAPASERAGGDPGKDVRDPPRMMWRPDFQDPVSSERNTMVGMGRPDDRGIHMGGTGEDRGMVSRLEKDRMMGGFDGDRGPDRSDRDPMVGRTDRDPMMGRPDRDPMMGRPDMMGRSDRDPMMGRPERDPMMGRPDRDYMMGRPDRDPMMGRPDRDSIMERPDRDREAMPMMGGTSRPDRESIIGNQDQDLMMRGMERPNRDLMMGRFDKDSLMGRSDRDSLMGRPERDTMMGRPERDPIMGRPDRDPMMGRPDRDPSEIPKRDPTMGRPNRDLMMGRPDQDPMMGKQERDPMMRRPDRDLMIGRPDRDPMMGRPDRDPVMGRTSIDPMMERPDRDPMMGRPDRDPMMGRPDRDPMMGRPDRDPMMGRPDRNPMMGRPGSGRDPMMGRPDRDPMMGMGRPDRDPVMGRPDRDPMMGRPDQDLMGRPSRDPMMDMPPGRDAIMGRPDKDFDLGKGDKQEYLPDRSGDPGPMTTMASELGEPKFPPGPDRETITGSDAATQRKRTRPSRFADRAETDMANEEMPSTQYPPEDDDFEKLNTSKRPKDDLAQQSRMPPGAGAPMQDQKFPPGAVSRPPRHADEEGFPPHRFPPPGDQRMPPFGDRFGPDDRRGYPDGRFARGEEGFYPPGDDTRMPAQGFGPNERDRMGDRMRHDFKMGMPRDGGFNPETRNMRGDWDGNQMGRPDFDVMDRDSQGRRMPPGFVDSRGGRGFPPGQGFPPPGRRPFMGPEDDAQLPGGYHGGDNFPPRKPPDMMHSRREHDDPMDLDQRGPDMMRGRDRPYGPRDELSETPRGEFHRQDFDDGRYPGPMGRGMDQPPRGRGDIYPMRGHAGPLSGPGRGGMDRFDGPHDGGRFADIDSRNIAGKPDMPPRPEMPPRSGMHPDMADRPAGSVPRMGLLGNAPPTEQEGRPEDQRDSEASKRDYDVRSSRRPDGDPGYSSDRDRRERGRDRDYDERRDRSRSRHERERERRRSRSRDRSRDRDRRRSRDRKESPRRSETRSKVIHIKNMLTSCNYRELRRFFQPMEIPNNGIKIINDAKGERTGEAFVRFLYTEDAHRAVRRNGLRMEGRTVTIDSCSEETFVKAIDSQPPQKSVSITNKDTPKSSKPDAPSAPPMPVPSELSAQTVRLSNLPQKVTITEIGQFFIGIPISNNGQAVSILRDSGGNCTGLAFVQFKSDFDYKKGLALDGNQISGNTVRITPAKEKAPATKIEPPAEDNVKKPVTTAASTPVQPAQPKGPRAPGAAGGVRQGLTPPQAPGPVRPGQPTPPGPQRPSLTPAGAGSIRPGFTPPTPGAGPMRPGLTPPGSGPTRPGFTPPASGPTRPGLAPPTPTRPGLTSPTGPPPKPGMAAPQGNNAKLASKSPETTSGPKPLAKPGQTTSKTPTPSAVPPTSQPVADTKQPNKPTDSSQQQSETVCVHIQGLPLLATPHDIRQFFNDCQIALRGVNIAHDSRGKPLGEGFVEFKQRADFDKAIKKDKTSMGRHIVAVKAIGKKEMLDRLARNQGQVPQTPPSPMSNSERQMSPAGHKSMSNPAGPPPNGPPRNVNSPDGGKPLPMHRGVEVEMQRKPLISAPPPTILPGGAGSKSIPPGVLNKDWYYVRCQDFPSDISIQEIMHFFHQFRPIGDSIRLHYSSDGHPTGNAVVGFGSAQDAQMALQRLHLRPCGQNMVSLFPA